jgi:hypothetical protein
MQHIIDKFYNIPHNIEMAKEEFVMLQALVMTIAAQICTEVAIRDIDDVTIAFRFQTEEGVNAFVEAILPHEGMLSFSRFESEVLVTFAQE